MDDPDQTTLQELLQDELGALYCSCKGFYEGKNFEAPRIAVSVSNLVDTRGRNMVSLLDQMNLTESQYFISVRGSWDIRVLPQMPLASFALDGKGGVLFQPPSELPVYIFSRFKRFSDWWEEPIYADQHSEIWTRSKLVRTVRDKRGSHLDPLGSSNSFLRTYSGQTNGAFKSNGSPLKVTLAHIGLELHQSLLKRDVWSTSREAREIWNELKAQGKFKTPGSPWGVDRQGRQINSIRMAWQAPGEAPPMLDVEHD